MKYKDKVDLLALLPNIVMMVAISVGSLLFRHVMELWIVLAFIGALAFFAFGLYISLSVYSELGESELIIGVGFHRTKIPYDKIVSVEKVKDNKRAKITSYEIKYLTEDVNKPGSVIVSPAHENEFLRQLECRRKDYGAN